jgi:molecular chaperone GrpE (heat shock protein)
MSEETLNKTYEEVVALKDLFLRRLMDDKVKTAAMAQLKEQNDLLQKRLDEKNLSAFVKEILLVCDRIESQESIDSLTASVEEEILELLARREIYQMEQTVLFDPRYHNAVGTVPAGDEYPDKSIVKVVRNGYLLRDQVFRPADVIVAVKTIYEE